MSASIPQDNITPPPSASIRDRAIAAIPPPTPQYRKPRLTPGRLFYLFYHAPKGALRKGPVKIFRGWRGRSQLQRALPGLQFPEPPSTGNAPPLALHALIGARYIAEACLLTHSLAHASGRHVAPKFYDDGTLTPDDCALLRSKLPRATFFLHQEIEQRLAERLPETRFPCLRWLRPAYPHIRKLTDIHLFPDEWKLVSDADILFFRRPGILLDNIESRRACHMVDIAPAYGVPQTALETLAGRPVYPKVNVGLCHLPSSSIDWEFVEHCAATLLATHGFSYYLEQALTAILLARLDATPLPAGDYVVYPDAVTARRADTAAMHYVDDSRAFYYDFAWRQIMAATAS
ncbi:hypothetical protein Ga0100231_023045 [Opitutaceae bacterium TAV4]|nr:hypothetical protein Ga0100231_023045 [Opitutaceae bacterium TAV4]RRK00722.1 hypothetical protein Ga0100230_023300 [Opitutaceae bacterium TAV3]